MRSLFITRRTKDMRLYCFSPPVMIATFAIEIVGLLYVVIRYHLNTLGRLVSATLLFLAVFQLAEYNVCGGYGLSAEYWSRVGFAAITTLPPLGMHIMYVLMQKPARRLVWLSYVSMVGFVTYFLAVPGVFQSYDCNGNYVIFQLGTYASTAYGAFYYGWLFTAIGIGLIYSYVNRIAKKNSVLNRNRQSVISMIVGYSIFIVPTAIVNSIEPTTASGLPSIMCGFAVLFGVILTLHILPLHGVKRLK